MPQPVEPPEEETVDVAASAVSCPTALLTGEAGTFTFAVNDDATGPLGFAFDFNTDGTTDATGNLEETTTFDAAGTYTVTFTATGPDNVSLATCQVTVADPVVDPVAALTCPAAPLLTGEAGTFTGSVNADATGPLSYAFDFDTDGTTDTTGNLEEMASFATAGIYTATFTATGPESSSQATCTVLVEDPVVAPVTSLSCPTTLEVGAEGTFTGLVNSDATGPLDYTFDFGSGLGPIGTVAPTGSFTYTAAGTYTVVFVATGPGGSDDSTCDVTVTEPVVDPPADETVPVVASLSCPTQVLSGVSKTYTGAVNADATGPVTYSFVFQNGNNDGGTVSGTLTGSSVSVNHLFRLSSTEGLRGTRTVTFTATGPGPDNTDTASCTVEVVRGGGGGIIKL